MMLVLDFGAFLLIVQLMRSFNSSTVSFILYFLITSIFLLPFNSVSLPLVHWSTYYMGLSSRVKLQCLSCSIKGTVFRECFFMRITLFLNYENKYMIISLLLNNLDIVCINVQVYTYSIIKLYCVLLFPDLCGKQNIFLNERN